MLQLLLLFAFPRYIAGEYAPRYGVQRVGKQGVKHGDRMILG